MKSASLILVMVVLVGSFGCAGHQSDIDKAYNIVHSISLARNALQPIYDAVYALHPDLKDKIEPFDHDFHLAIDITLNTIAAWRAGTGTKEQYQVALQGIIDVLNKYEIDKKVPELIPTLTLVKSLLGILPEQQSQVLGAYSMVGGS